MSKGTGTKWCGPWALAFLTDRDYDTADKHIRRKIKRKTKVQGLSTYGMHKSLGPKSKGFTRTKRVTLQKLSDQLLPGRIYLIWVTGHYLILDTGTGMVIHNQVEIWKPVEECRYKQTQVRGYLCWTPRKTSAVPFREKQGL